MVLGVEDEGSKYWVLAGRTIQPQSDTVRIVTGFLLIAMPLLLAVVGLSVDFLVGRSLRQVDTIRTQGPDRNSRSKATPVRLLCQPRTAEPAHDNPHRLGHLHR